MVGALHTMNKPAVPLYFDEGGAENAPGDEAEIFGWTNRGAIRASIGVRNIGAGPAVLAWTRLTTRLPAGESIDGRAVQAVVAPGEAVRLLFSALVTDESAQRLAPLLDAVQAYSFDVWLSYSSLDGSAGYRTRFQIDRTPNGPAEILRVEFYRGDDAEPGIASGESPP
jgi:hypothetical protein